jgi:hypothetical protein
MLGLAVVAELRYAMMTLSGVPAWGEILKEGFRLWRSTKFLLLSAPPLTSCAAGRGEAAFGQGRASYARSSSVSEDP